MNEPSAERRTPSHRRGVDGVGVEAVVFEGLVEAVVRERMQEAILEEPQAPVVDPAQERHRLDHLVQHDLQALSTGHGVEHAADRPLLRTRRLEPALEFF
jgi:hypothetical protein